MKPDEIDRILGSEEPIVPSSGFTASVMETIRSNAVAPEPISFPWRRAIPGVAAGAIAVAVLLIVAAIALMHPQAQVGSSSDSAALGAVVRYFADPADAWLGFGALLSLAALLFGFRVAFRRS
jgi:hypothetical protein